MTIAQALNGYSNGKLVIDKFVYQYVSITSSRVVYRFAFDSSHLYLRKEEAHDFNGSIEDIELFDEDISETMAETIAKFLATEQYQFDIYKRDIDIPAEQLLSQSFINENGLIGAVFKTY